MAKVTRSTSRIAVAVLAALALGVPAQARAAGLGSGCPSQRLAQTFLRWADLAWYAQVPDGGFEARGAGWTLTGGGAVVEGNEPYFVGTPLDTQSLSLPSGASATSPPVCIGIEHPTIRFFVRNTGSPEAVLTVSVVFRDLGGQLRSLPIGKITGVSAWSPTPIVPVTINLLSPKAAFRFAPADGRGKWTIDDVYVDPYGKG